MREQAGPSGSKDTPPTPPFTEVHLKSNRDPYKIASKDLKGLWCRSSGIAVLRTSHMCGPTFGRALLDYAWDQITGRAPNYEIAIMITQEALTGYFTERRALEAAQAAAAAAQSRPADCLRGVAVNDQLFGGSTAFDDVYGGLHVEERGGVQYVRLWDGTEAALLTAFQVFEPTPEGAKQVRSVRLRLLGAAQSVPTNIFPLRARSCWTCGWSLVRRPTTRRSRSRSSAGRIRSRAPSWAPGGSRAGPAAATPARATRPTRPCTPRRTTTTPSC